ncbi:MAG: helix-turn-helix transcriptional regulator [Burkholderiales bacterium]|nr:helix-turn-helix transcriptional regulator [Opitutaceae bacterium]
MKHAGFREDFNALVGRSLLPELLHFGWTRQARVRPAVPPHRHPGAFEFHLMERGGTDWWVEKETYALTAGQVSVTQPDEWHGSAGPHIRPCGYYWLILKTDGGLPGLEPEDASAIKAGLRAITRRCFTASGNLHAHFRALWELHQKPTGDAFRAPVALRARLHLLIEQLLTDHAAAENHAEGWPEGAEAGGDGADDTIRAGGGRNGKPRVSRPIARALQALHDESETPLTVAALARVAGLGTTQFTKRFVEETGVTPTIYRRHRRVERARALLAAGRHSIVEVAQLTGFSSSQNFATVFRQVEGLTPGAFAAAARRMAK